MNKWQAKRDKICIICLWLTPSLFPFFSFCGAFIILFQIIVFFIFCSLLTNSKAFCEWELFFLWDELKLVFFCYCIEFQVHLMIMKGLFFMFGINLCIFFWNILNSLGCFCCFFYKLVAKTGFSLFILTWLIWVQMTFFFWDFWIFFFV